MIYKFVQEKYYSNLIETICSLADSKN